MKRMPLRVSLHAREPSVVELTVGGRVQLDRLIPAHEPSPRGYLAERHGRLLDPGVNRLALPAGHYFFKTLSAADLRDVAGGVAARIAPRDIKNNPPDPSHVSTGSPLPNDAGDEPTGESLRFTIE